MGRLLPVRSQAREPLASYGAKWVGSGLCRLAHDRYASCLMVKRSAYLAGALLLSGCADFDEPEAVDPTPVLGCYVAPESPTISIEQAGVQIGQSPGILSYRYEQAKVGMVLRIPMVASVDEGRFQLKSGDEHFYRVISTDAGPFIRVAFYPDGTVKDYQRRSLNAC